MPATTRLMTMPPAMPTQANNVADYGAVPIWLSDANANNRHDAAEIATPWCTPRQRQLP